MDAPPQHESYAPFVRIARLMGAAGLNVPRVLAEDLQEGYLLLTDLGRHTLLDVIDDANADACFAAAIDTLVLLQKASRPDVLPAYDAALLRREMQLFPDWYLGVHLGVPLSAAGQQEFDAVAEALAAAALVQPRVYVHRDYMPRNLMPGAPRLGVLDFQDAVYGPLTYDVISLFKDAFRSWPPERIDGWLRLYHVRAVAAGVPVPDWAEFRRDCDWMGLQRHLKVLGIFARLTHRDGKAKYVADTPRFVRYVMEVAPRYAELAPLARLFERCVLPHAVP